MEIETGIYQVATVKASDGSATLKMVPHRGQSRPEEEGMDLHALTRREGTPNVAERLGVSEPALCSWRSGRSTMPTDILARLLEEYPELDARATVLRLGQARASHRDRPARGVVEG